MQLDDLNRTQLYRLYRRLYRRLGYGGMFGWDWVTLHAVNPSLYHAIRAVAYAHDHSEGAGHE